MTRDEFSSVGLDERWISLFDGSELRVATVQEAWATSLRLTPKDIAEVLFVDTNKLEDETHWVIYQAIAFRLTDGRFLTAESHEEKGKSFRRVSWMMFGSFEELIKIERFVKLAARAGVDLPGMKTRLGGHKSTSCNYDGAPSGFVNAVLWGISFFIGFCVLPYHDIFAGHASSEPPELLKPLLFGAIVTGILKLLLTVLLGYRFNSTD